MPNVASIPSLPYNQTKRGDAGRRCLLYNCWSCPTANIERLLPGGDSRWGHMPEWQGAEDGAIKLDGTSTWQRCHAGSSLAIGSKENTAKGRAISCLPQQQLRQLLLLSTLGQSWLLKFSLSQLGDPSPWVGAVLHLHHTQHHKSVQLHISAPWCQTGIMRAPESKCHHSSLAAVPLPTLHVSQLVGGQN